MHLEGLALDGRAQVALEAEPLERARVHVGVEQLVARSALRLGLVHRRVGIAHDFFRVRVFLAAERDADAGRREHLVDANREGHAERVLNPHGDRVGLYRISELVQQNRELVAAQPGERVAGAQALFETSRHGVISSSPTK